MDAQLKISRGIITLVTKFTFYGSCALKLNIRECPDTETMATDGLNIYWGRKAVDEWTEDEVVAVLAHEIFHVVLLHHLRLSHVSVNDTDEEVKRSAKKWNIATDLCINPTLKQDGFKLPKGVLFDKKYINWNAEKIYKDIDESLYEDPEWGFVMELTDEKGKPLSEDAKNKAIDEVKEMIVSAADAAKKAGQTLNGKLSDIVQNVRTPQVNWVNYLRTLIQTRSPDETTWARPNRKMLASLDIYMPSNISNRCGPLAFIIDTSASVSRKEREVFLAELQSINESIKPEAMHIICVDTQVAICHSFTPHDDITELELRGGGGTDMTPGFDYVRDCLPEVNIALCFSDCEFHEWPPEPDIEVIWLSTGETNNPYGTLIPVSIKEGR